MVRKLVLWGLKLVLHSRQKDSLVLLVQLVRLFAEYFVWYSRLVLQMDPNR